MFPGIGLQEIMIIGVIAVILFGRKLPEVAKSVGKSYYEFRKGLFDVQDGFDPRKAFMGGSSEPKRTYQDEYDDYDEATAPRFEPPPAENDEA